MTKKLADYIMVVEDVIPAPLAREILDEYANDTTWSSYSGNYTGSGSVIPISMPAVLGQSAKRREIEKKITEHFTDAYKKYYAKHARLEQGYDFLMARNCTGFRLLRYRTGESLPIHTDKHPNLTANQNGWPLVSASVLLNDDFGGGELVLLDGEVIPSLKAGAGVFFPSTFLFPHSVNKVTRGTRYVVVTWFL